MLVPNSQNFPGLYPEPHWGPSEQTHEGPQSRTANPLLQSSEISGSHPVNIGAAYQVLGPEKSNALLGFHAFTGCDYTSKFNGKSKKTCWKTCLVTREDMLAAFAYLGFRGGLVYTKLTSFEKYVVHLYYESGDLNSLTDTRQSNYTRKQDCNNKVGTDFRQTNCQTMPQNTQYFFRI